MKEWLQTFRNYDEFNIYCFCFRSEVMNVSLWNGMDSEHLIVCWFFFLNQGNVFFYGKTGFKCVRQKKIGTFSVTNWHEI